MPPRLKPQAILLVDGYNIIGTWSDLKQVKDLNGLAEARHKLLQCLANYSAFQGFDTQVVFDAQYRDDPGIREVITENLSAQFTDFGQTADTFIEKACAAFRYDLRKFQQRLIVATSDRAQQLTVVGYGAEWMSAQRLASEVEAIARRVQRQQQSTRRSPNRFLASSLDPVAQKRLTDLRFGKGKG